MHEVEIAWKSNPPYPGFRPSSKAYREVLWHETATAAQTRRKNKVDHLRDNSHLNFIKMHLTGLSGHRLFNPTIPHGGDRSRTYRTSEGRIPLPQRQSSDIRPLPHCHIIAMRRLSSQAIGAKYTAETPPSLSGIVLKSPFDKRIQVFVITLP